MLFLINKEVNKLQAGIIFIFALAVFEYIYIVFLKKELSEMKKWQKIALTDDLTQIPNRAAYSLHTRELIAMKDKDVSLILIDIDDFKKYNDTMGHIEGDAVLKKCAGMLLEVFSDKVFKVFRIGGDEFAVIGHKVKEDFLIDRMLETRRREDKGEISFRISKGYAMSDGKANFKTIFKRADEMLYADKMYKLS